MNVQLNIFRDINLSASDSPLASKIAPNGNPYTALLFLDFNAMYLWSQQQEMPLGPGLRWIRHKNGFRKFVLQGQTSFSAVQWLQYEQTKYQVQIQHAYHQGEKVVYGMLYIITYIAYGAYVQLFIFKDIMSMDMLSLMVLKQSGNTMGVNIMDVNALKIHLKSIWKTNKNGLREKRDWRSMDVK